jgi:hypothetical protein
MSTAIIAALAAAISGIGMAPATQADMQAKSADLAVAVAANYSASGTHQCRTTDGETHSCVVTGVVFGTCIEAGSSLRAQDCCPSSRVCERDAQGRETNCRRGGTSAGFTLNYCIPGR